MNTTLKSTFEDLITILRSCPVEQLPATPQSATAPDPPPPPIENPKSKIKNTLLGTPAAKSWDDAWLDTVNATETRLGRRICGARQVDGTPCELASDHHTGRCRFHGGFDLTGAAPGNRNAYIHGLYSRRLKTCGDHCPNWATCPMVQPDIETVPLSKRPICPYEQHEYNTALADALDVSCDVSRIDPFAIHIAHNVAILQVLIGRATTEMRNTNIVSQTSAASEKYSFNHEQIRPHINAIARIGGEIRRYLALLEKGAPANIQWDAFQDRLRWMRSTEPGPEPEQFDYVAPDEKQIANQRKRSANLAARNAITRAIMLANNNQQDDAIEQWRQALQADAQFTENWTASLRRSIKARQRAAARKSPPP